MKDWEIAILVVSAFIIAFIFAYVYFDYRHDVETQTFIEPSTVIDWEHHDCVEEYTPQEWEFINGGNTSY